MGKKYGQKLEFETVVRGKIGAPDYRILANKRGPRGQRLDVGKARSSSWNLSR